MAINARRFLCDWSIFTNLNFIGLQLSGVTKPGPGPGCQQISSGSMDIADSVRLPLRQ